MNGSLILGLKIQIYFMISNKKKKPPKWMLSFLQNTNKIEFDPTEIVTKSDGKIKLWNKYEKGLRRLNIFIQFMFTISSQVWFSDTVLNAPPNTGFGG